MPSLAALLLANADFEIIPLKGVLEQVAAIPPGSTVSVTASPAKGIEATVDLAVELRERGFRAVPHLSAHLIDDRQHLRSVVKRLDHAGIDKAFVVGGDAATHGDYPDALSLLVDLATIGHPFVEVGIAGYPEGHPKIPADVLQKALGEKQPYATYLVTQMCFDASTIARWVRSIRDSGVTLPVKVGVPGAVDTTRLLTMGAKIGVGDSLSFLAKNRRAVLRMLRPGRYRPHRLIEPLARIGDGLGLDGVHVFTFNQISSTVAWHRKAQERFR